MAYVLLLSLSIARLRRSVQFLDEFGQLIQFNSESLECFVNINKTYSKLASLNASFYKAMRDGVRLFGFVTVRA